MKILQVTLFIFGIIFFITNPLMAGNATFDISGSWQMNLDIKVEVSGIDREIIRLESLPLNIIIQQYENIINILPEYYLKGGFRGTGDIKNELLYFTAYSFEETLFTEGKFSIRAFDLNLEYAGIISPQSDYITGYIKGNLIVEKNKWKVPCNVKEGSFTLMKIKED